MSYNSIIDILNLCYDKNNNSLKTTIPSGTPVKGYKSEIDILNIVFNDVDKIKVVQI